MDLIGLLSKAAFGHCAEVNAKFEKIIFIALSTVGYSEAGSREMIKKLEGYVYLFRYSQAGERPSSFLSNLVGHKK